MSHAASKMFEQNGDGGPLWESTWPLVSALDVTGVRVTAKNFNDGKPVRKARRAVLFLAEKHAT